MRILLNWRYYVLLAIGFVAVIGIFSEPIEDDCAIWGLNFILSKAIGFGAAYAMYRLIDYWVGKNQLPELEKLAEDKEDDLWE